MSAAQPLRHSNRLAWQARAHKVWAAGTEAPHGVRTLGQLTLVPAMRAGEMRNLWVIEADGHAHFLTHGKSCGCSYVVGQPSNMVLVVVDFIDAVRWHEDLGIACVVAFNVENMLHVIRRVWLDHDAKIIVATNSYDSRIQDAARAVRAAYLRSDLTEWGKCS
ncbi:MAG: hypothetical protein KJ889_01660 [Gammaproteobacteria bacterium]|nr:hypothetical protein [Gammaproteobacteria bacterium]